MASSSVITFFIGMDAAFMNRFERLLYFLKNKNIIQSQFKFFMQQQFESRFLEKQLQLLWIEPMVLFDAHGIYNSEELQKVDDMINQWRRHGDNYFAFVEQKPAARC
jgi:hypothetical protein